jgi:hypothetical protein
MYASTDTRYPLYSIPHFNLTRTSLPVRSLRKGLGLTGAVCGDGMGWDGMGWDGMGWDGMGWDGMGSV